MYIRGRAGRQAGRQADRQAGRQTGRPVANTHLRAHETPEHLVCRLLLEKKKERTAVTQECRQLDHQIAMHAEKHAHRPEVPQDL